MMKGTILTKITSDEMGTMKLEDGTEEPVRVVTVTKVSKTIGSDYSGMGEGKALLDRIRHDAEDNLRHLDADEAASLNERNQKALDALKTVQAAIDDINGSGIIAYNYGRIYPPEPVDITHDLEHEGFSTEIAVKVTATQFGRPTVTDCILAVGKAGEQAEDPGPVGFYEQWSHDECRYVMPGDDIMDQEKVVSAIVGWIGHEGATAHAGLHTYMANCTPDRSALVIGHMNGKARRPVTVVPDETEQLGLTPDGCRLMMIKVGSDSSLQQALDGKRMNGSYRHAGEIDCKDGEARIGAGVEGCCEPLFSVSGKWEVWIQSDCIDDLCWIVLTPQSDDARITDVYRAAASDVSYDDLRDQLSMLV